MPDDAPWADPVVVPDDLRELQPDIDAYHRERRRTTRRQRWAWLTGSRAWQRAAMPLAVVLGALGLAGVVFAVLTIDRPAPIAGPAAAPIASAPPAPAGALHGLLPDVAVSTSAGTRSIQGLRPALVALVPLHCGCTSLLAGLAGQAEEVTVPLVVVAPTAPGRDAEVSALAGQVHLGRVETAFDASGELAATYDAAGVTVLVVNPDATVGYVQTNVTATTRLELPLQQIVHPTATVSGH